MAEIDTACSTIDAAIEEIARLRAENEQLRKGDKPEPNPEWEAKAKAYHEMSIAEHGVQPFDTLNMLEEWKSDAEPANELGQVSFTRAMLDSATDALRTALEISRNEYLRANKAESKLSTARAEALEEAAKAAEGQLGGYLCPYGRDRPGDPTYNHTDTDKCPVCGQTGFESETQDRCNDRVQFRIAVVIRSLARDKP